ncbi:WXG100 family type VII secretion target [Kitasatospora sp. NPDC090091]|uniref:WXG100 family type VII secretion target n=1 Tax=Kitasatospora sp. NPDC090091 TaxID=3364081 RepID=UPI0037F4F1B2
MPDYNGHGFHQGDDGTVFGSPDGTAVGSRNDYVLWDWKQIMAAITGMSAGVGSDANHLHAQTISDPQSLQNAANVFHRVQRSLEAVGKSLVDQAKALAGDDGPWRGPAADAFLDMMTTFSRQVLANAKVLSGGSTGRHSVPQQLANNAVTLKNARDKIVEIDHHYANEAIRMNVTPMSNGLIPISQKPELVHMMSEDMRVVLQTLAAHYQFTVDAIVSPQPVPSPINDPADGPGADGPGGPEPLPDPAGLGTGLPGGGDPIGTELGAFGPGGLDPAGLGSAGLDPAGLDPTALDPTGFGSVGDLGGGTGGVGDLDGLGLLGRPTPFPGGTGLGGLGGLDPTGLDGALHPVSFPGLGGLDGPGRFGGLDGLGGLDGAGLGALGALPSLALGGIGGLGSLPKGLAAGRAGTSAGLAGFPRGLGLGGRVGTGQGDGEETGTGTTDGLREGAPLGLTAGTATESGLPAGFGGAGMPFMPGMGGAPAGRGADGSGERSDASGLLAPSSEPWESGAAGEDHEAGSADGAAAGGEGLMAGGLPFLPAAGAAPAAGRSEDATGVRSEAFGLLDPSAEPWAAAEGAGDAASAGSPAPAVLPGVGLLPGFGAAAVSTAPAARTSAVGPEAQRRPAEAGAAAEATGAQERPGPAEPLTVAERTAALPRPVPDGTEEDPGLWDREAGAFVELLWAVGPARDGRDGTEDRTAATDDATTEPWSTWQPDRAGATAAAGAHTASPLVLGCGEGGPEPEPEPAEETDPSEAEEPAEQRGFAHLLVQEESVWGTAPEGRAGTGATH